MRRRRATPLDPLLAWNTLGIRWMEMMAASQAVIAHRSGRRNSSAQLFEMGSEKAEALLASSNAMARRMLAPVPSSGAGMWDAWMKLMQAGMAPYHATATRNARRARRGPRR